MGVGWDGMRVCPQAVLTAPEAPFAKVLRHQPPLISTRLRVTVSPHPRGNRAKVTFPPPPRVNTRDP